MNSNNATTKINKMLRRTYLPILNNLFMVDFEAIFEPNLTEVNIGNGDIYEGGGPKSAQKRAVKKL
jgi:hypothetical protein